MRTKVKGTPGNQSCTVLNSNISGQAKSSMTVGATDDEIKWQLGGQLATSEYCMCGGMDSSDHDYYFWNKRCQETVSGNATGIGCLY